MNDKDKEIDFIKKKINEWKVRGFLKKVTSEKKLISIIKKKEAFYCGFDPTSFSLHIGHFLLLTFITELWSLGCKPIIILGTATTRIGDPSFRSKKRVFLSLEEIYKNKKNIKNQIISVLENLKRQYLQKNPQTKFSFEKNDVKFLDNNEWLNKISIISFLDEIGNLFTVNKILERQSLEEALKRDALFYSDFSYILLQAYDFYYLYKNHHCRLQIGGSDQFPNLVFGTKLIQKKISKNDICALTTTLLEDSSGNKISKSINYNVLFHQKNDLNWLQILQTKLALFQDEKTDFLYLEKSISDIFSFFLSLDDQTLKKWDLIFDFKSYWNFDHQKNIWDKWTLQKQFLWVIAKFYYAIIFSSKDNIFDEKNYHWNIFKTFIINWNERKLDNNKKLNQIIKTYYCFDKKINQQQFLTKKDCRSSNFNFFEKINLIPSLWIFENKKYSLLNILMKLMSFNNANSFLKKGKIVINETKISKNIEDVFAFINQDQNSNQKISNFILRLGKNKIYFVQFDTTKIIKKYNKNI